MSGPNRPTRAYGSPVALTSEESGGGFADRPTNPSGADARGTRGAHHAPAADSRGGFHTRSFRFPRRSSSGYFSYESDSLPVSPLSPRPLTANKYTQTPSACAQVITHAMNSLAASGYGPEESALQRQHGRGSSSTWPPNATREMQARSIGRELRRQGDEFNRLLMERRLAGRMRPLGLPRVHQRPTVYICVGLLIIFVGRLLYSHSGTFSHSQV